jgi:2-polyprenyl-3-methyl-5-hydroxy-6-metoxy-1,4-benzoquinol methylase
MTETVLSPVTQSSPAKLVDSILTKEIIKLYKEEFAVDVSNYFDGKERIGIYECLSTGYKFYYPFSLAGNAQFYEELQNQHKKLGLSYYREWGYDHEFAFHKVDNGDFVLDIGCGSGIFLERIKAKTPNIFGLEFNEMAIRSCEKKGISVKKEFIQEHAKKNREVYDVVCAFQVLEHVCDIKSFIESVLLTLKKGGKFIIGVPNNQPFFQRFNKYEPLNLPPHHMGLWNKNTFINLQNHFPVKFLEAEYDRPGKPHIDAYFRAKYFFNIKSRIQKHSLAEKIEILLASPFTLLMSSARYIFQGIPGGFIVVSFKKK